MKTFGRTKPTSIAFIAFGALSISTFPTTSIAAPFVEQVHKAGPTTTSSANTIRNGKGAPSNALGKDGDFYIDTLKLNFYGPKANGVWTTPISLRGPAGATGTAGKKGATGSAGKPGAIGARGATKAITGATGAKGVPGETGPSGPSGPSGPGGPSGAVGAIGLTGSNGLPGSVGPAGSSGSVGPAGSSGSVGPAGSSGSIGATGPSGSTGSVGATGPQGFLGTQGSVGATGGTGLQGATGGTGLQGATGGTGLQGATGGTGLQGATGGTGLQGATGLTGATGPSDISLGSITFSQQLKAGTGAAVSSSAFGNFAATKQYFVRLLIYGVRSVTDFASLRINIYAVGGSPTIQTSYLISDGHSYRTALGENDTNLDVVVAVDASAVLNSFQLGATISSLDDTSSDSITFAGSYVSELVGSLT